MTTTQQLTAAPMSIPAPSVAGVAIYNLLGGRSFLVKSLANGLHFSEGQLQFSIPPQKIATGTAAMVRITLTGTDAYQIEAFAAKNGAQLAVLTATNLTLQAVFTQITGISLA